VVLGRLVVTGDGGDFFGDVGLYAFGDVVRDWFCFSGLAYGLWSAAAARSFAANASWLAKLGRAPTTGVCWGVVGTIADLPVSGSMRIELSPNTSSRMSDASSASKPRQSQYSR
jgi:hypothetical protein